MDIRDVVVGHWSSHHAGFVQAIAPPERSPGSKLRVFKSSLASNPKEAESYAFLLGSALDTVDSGAKDHRDLLAEQEEAFKHKKKQDRKDDSQRPE